MGIISCVGTCIKNTADRALLTITRVLTRSTEEANDSSRSSINIPNLVEDHAIVPVVDSLAAIDVSLGTTDRRTAFSRHVSARIDMESVKTSEDERHFKRKVLLASASTVMGLASGVPFMLLSVDPERRKSSLTTQLLVSSCAIVLAILFFCMVMMCLLLYWGVRYLETAGYICIIAGFLIFLLEVFGILLVLQTVYT